MTERRTARTVTALGLGVLVTAAGVLPAQAAPNRGFEPVRATASAGQALTAVSANEAWVAGAGADGRIVVERIAGRRSTSTTLDVTAGYEPISLDNSSSRMVWLAAGGELWQYNGRKWARVTMPEGVTRVSAVHVASSRVVYVGAQEPNPVPNPYGLMNNVIYKHDVRAGTWERIPGPVRPGPADSPGGQRIDRIKLVGSQLFTEVTYFPPASSYFMSVHRLDGSTWTKVVATGDRGGGANSASPGWIASAPDRQLFLGASLLEGAPQRPTCIELTAAGTQECQTRTAVGGADATTRGRVVIGGTDWQSWDQETTQFVQHEGIFVLRRPDGTERQIPGDPGDRTIAVDAPSRGTTVWALTSEGERTWVQRYRG